MYFVIPYDMSISKKKKKKIIDYKKLQLCTKSQFSIPNTTSNILCSIYLNLFIITLPHGSVMDIFIYSGHI